MQTCGVPLGLMDYVAGVDGKVLNCLQDHRDELKVSLPPPPAPSPAPLPPYPIRAPSPKCSADGAAGVGLVLAALPARTSQSPAMPACVCIAARRLGTQQPNAACCILPLDARPEAYLLGHGGTACARGRIMPPAHHIESGGRTGRARAAAQAAECTQEVHKNMVRRSEDIRFNYPLAFACRADRPRVCATEQPVHPAAPPCAAKTQIYLLWHSCSELCSGFASTRGLQRSAPARRSIELGLAGLRLREVSGEGVLCDAGCSPT